LANIKSQIKRNKQNEKRRLRNRGYRGSARIAVRDARAALDSGDAEETRAAILGAISALDKAAEKGVIHKNNAARRKSRLMKRMAFLDIELKSAQVETSKEEEEKEAAPKKKAASKKKTAKKDTKKSTSKKAE
jgi:small subunit ribosomal protein S20